MTKILSVACFPTTCWSRVAAAADPAAPEARGALAELCTAYWYPVYAFIRGRGHDPDESADLAQDFFIRLMEKGLLAAADPEKGRFRTLLLADCTHFLADRRDHRAARKRSGGRVAVPIDARDAEGRYRHEPVHDSTPERLFERAWAVILLGQALERLRLDYEKSGQAAAFDQLKVVLETGFSAPPYAELAARLGTTEGAVQVAIHRLRRRYRDHLRQVIASTVAGPGEIDDEIRALFAALGP